MLPFSYDPSISIRFGPGASRDISGVIDEMNGRRVFVVTDPGVCAAPPTGDVVRSVLDGGRETEVFDAVHANPTSELVDRGVCLARAFGPDVIVGLGGGSAMDCAKGINFVLTNGGRIEDYQGFGKAQKAMLPGIGIPTTAGTGSEAQSYALISRSDTHEKMACGDRKARFRTVLLDPELVATTPDEVRARAGLDAIAHALESYVTKTRTPVSRLFSEEAWSLLDGSFERYYENPGDVDAASDVLLGAHFAGTAIEASMLGAAHACANPLTARYDLAHGEAVAVMLPHVIAFNAAGDASLYAGLGMTPEALVNRVMALRAGVGLRERLSSCGVEHAALPALAREAYKQWTGAHNPRPVDVGAYESLYAAAF